MQVLIQGMNAYCTDIFSANFHMHLSRIFKSRKYSPQIAFSKCFKTKSEKIIVKIFKAKKNAAAPFKTQEIFTTCCEQAIYMFFNVRC